MATKSNVVALTTETETAPMLTRTEQMFALADAAGVAAKGADETTGGFSSALHALVNGLIGFSPSVEEITEVVKRYATARARRDWNEKSAAKLTREIRRACKVGADGWAAINRTLTGMARATNDTDSALARALYDASAWTLSVKVATDAHALGFVPNDAGIRELYPVGAKDGVERALAKISAIVAACNALSGGKDGDNPASDPRGRAYAEKWTGLAARMGAQVEDLRKIAGSSPEERAKAAKAAFDKVKAARETFADVILLTAPAPADDIAF
jgi:hypothetical protein